MWSRPLLEIAPCGQQDRPRAATDHSCIMESSGIVVRAITRCGGIADAGTVIRLTSRQAVSEAVERRVIVRDALVSAHDSFRGHGRRHVLRVIEAADARAANPFESVLRAIALDVPGLQRLPQVEIRTPGRRLMRPDLVDARLQIAVGQLRASRLAKGTRAGLCPVRQPRRRRLDGVALCLGARDAPSGLGALDPRGRHRSAGRPGRVTSAPAA